MHLRRGLAPLVLIFSMLGFGMAASGCGASAAGGTATGATSTPRSQPPTSAAAAGSQPDPVVALSPTPGASRARPAAHRRSGPDPAARRPLAGKVIGIDPGHNGGNFTHPAVIDQLIYNGREQETCDTTGTATDAGYTEAQFNFHVASYLRADLIAVGAKVVMTRNSNNGVGPCVTTRAEIINRARANVAIDIHADGGPSAGRGFTVLEPVADGPNDAVIGSSQRFGADVRAALLHGTSMPESDYAGVAGIVWRDDLAGLNLTTVPKILIECGNMRNATDATLLVQPAFQRKLARAFTAAIIEFLTGR